MKYIFIISLLSGTICFGQFFEQPVEQEEINFNQTDPNSDYSTPDQGVDESDNGPGTPGEVPINQWIFLLPLAGLAIGSYQIFKNKTERI